MHARLHSRFVGHALMLALLVVGAPQPLLGTDWYWINDFGGFWDERIGGVPSWRDSADASGLPGAGDDALLVLPYSLSFCLPDGSCVTQPVVVQFRCDEDVTLNRVVIESFNILFQSDASGIHPSRLNLTSLTEVVGGSTEAFTPPPSFFFPPNSPGIFPVGRHRQQAGTNEVRDRLVIGANQFADVVGISPTEGIYELSGTGVLTVGEFGFGLEKIGAGGDGLFEQSGGIHSVNGTLILAEQSGSSGRYSLSDGSLDVEVASIIGSSGEGVVEQTGGTSNAVQLILGQQEGGAGTYHLSGTGQLTVSSTTIVGRNGTGEFWQDGGTHAVHRLVVGEQEGSSAFYILNGGALESDTTVVADAGMGQFDQSGGVHQIHGNLLVSAGDEATAEYRLQGGRLSADSSFVGSLGHGVFVQDNGPLGRQDLNGALLLGYRGEFDHDIPNVFLGVGTGRYTMSSGELHAERLHVADSGQDLTGVSRSEFYHHGGVVSTTGEVVIGNGSYVLSEGEIHSTRLPATSNLRTYYSDNALIVGGWTRGNQYSTESPGDAFFDQSGGWNIVAGDLTIGAHRNTRGSYTLRNGTLQVNGTLYNRSDDEARGSYEQFGGLANIEYLLNDDYVDVRGGEMVVGEITNSPHGTYLQSGGLVRVLGSISNDNEMRITGGELNVSYHLQNLLFSDAFRQSGGVVHVLGEVTSDSLMVITGGEMLAGAISNWRGYYFLQSDGIVRVVGSVTNGHLMHISGGELNVGRKLENYGNFEQSGGIVRVQGEEMINDYNMVILGGEVHVDGELFNTSAGSLTVRDGELNVNEDLWNSGDFVQWGGVVRVHGDVINNHIMNIWGGMLHVDGLLVNNEGSLVIRYPSVITTSGDTLVNLGTVTIDDAGTKIIIGRVDNRGLFDVNQGSVTFDGLFEHNGEYASREAISQFGDLSVGPAGVVRAAVGDTIAIAGDFLNASEAAESWDTTGAALIF